MRSLTPVHVSDTLRPTTDGGKTAVRAGTRGFTLAELLVVIVIIGVLASIGLPALRGLGESNAIDAATRQVLDDLAFARLRALNDRTTVYMLFAAPIPANALATAANHLQKYHFTSYTLYSRHSLGDQPGRSNPRQLMAWRTLPENVFFAKSKLLDPDELESQDRLPGTVPAAIQNLERPLPITTPVSLVISNLPPTQANGNSNLTFRCIAFNPQGQVVLASGETTTGRDADTYLALVRGSVLRQEDKKGNLLSQEPDFVAIPPHNRRYIRVNWLTGRASVVGDLLRQDSGVYEVIGGVR